jgi:hypothetical protein
LRAYSRNGASEGTYSVDNILGDKPEQRRARLQEYRRKDWPARKWNKEDRAWLRALCCRRAAERGVTVESQRKPKIEVLDELRIRPEGFAELMLGLRLYDWQARSVTPIELATKCRQNVAVCTPNGSGKDERIIPSAAFWWLMFHPRGRVRITSKSAVQLETQTIPNLNKHWRKFGWAEPISHPRYTLKTPTGGSLVAFVTNEGARFEGSHGTPDSPLLDIINEAKSIDADIYEGADRSSPDAQLLVSSPGLKEGRFYDCFGKLAHLYTTIQVGLAHCPHISADKIAAVESMYGPNHPITRSTLYGEFMDHVDEADAFLTYDMILGCEYDEQTQWLTDIAHCSNPLYVGVDVGRVKDLTVIIVLEKITDVFFTRRVITMAGETFEAQEAKLEEILSLPSVRRACIDSTGLGRQFAERAIKRFGVYKVEAVNFTAPVKEMLAYPVRSAFESKRLRIPRSTEIRKDLGSVRQEMTVAGNIRFIAERTEAQHADRFWSWALALHAGKTTQQPFSTESVRIQPSMLPAMPRFTPRRLQGWHHLGL